MFSLYLIFHLKLPPFENLETELSQNHTRFLIGGKQQGNNRTQIF